MSRQRPLKLLFGLMLLFSVISSFGQGRRITGTVTDEKGSPLGGATITARGAAVATTDTSGRFSFSLPANVRTVSVSYVGMQAQNVNITAGTDVYTIQLAPSAASLSDVVVVGYGTARRRDVTGAVGTIKARELTTTGTADPVQAMQGRVSGVQVVSASGEPGSGTRVRIRGIGSVNGSNPIYVVDGYQTGDISYLSPTDIESMDILKDASAAAIYGARGANGVVVITTRKGRSGPIRFTFDAYGGVQSVWRKIPMANPAEYATLVEEAFTNENQPVAANLKPALDAAIAGQYGAGTNWQNEIFQTAPIQNYTLSLSGGNEVNRIRLSGTFFNQQGVVKNTGMRKYFFNLNDELRASKWLRAGLSASFSHYDRSVYNADLYSGVLTNALSADPITPVWDTTKNNYGRPYISYANNPVRVVNELKGARTYNSLLVGNIWGEVTFMPGLTFRTQFNASFGNTHATTYLPAFFIDPVEQRSPSSLYDYRGEDVGWMWTNYANYTKSFGSHYIQAMVGAEIQNANHNELAVTAYNVPATASLQYIMNAQSTNYSINPNNVAFPVYSTGLQSFFGRVNYNYLERYLLTATVRRDASSRFLPGHRSGTFPAFGAGWVVSQENFLKNNQVISYLKLRGGWGQVGNEQSASQYPYITGIASNNLYVLNGSAVQGFAPNSYGNPLIRWETNQQSNIGIDINFIKNRLTFSADVFNRTTKNMILPVPIPIYAGAPASPYMNTGTMVNKGIEMNLSYSGGKDFTYTIGGNVTLLNNKITSVGQASSREGGYVSKLGNLSLMQQGQPFPLFYGLKTDGVFHSQEEVTAYTGKSGALIQPNAKAGDVKYVDADGDGAITAGDRVGLGSPNPSVQAGFNANFSYKNFDLSFFVMGVTGNKIVNAIAYNIRNVSNSPGGWFNSEKTRLDRWTPTNTNTNEPRMTVTDPNNNNQFSDRYVEDGSYIRMRNIQLGYTLPKSAIGKLGITNARFYLSADNLFTITSYKGFDPEVSGYYTDPFYNGIDVGGYPQPRNVRIGVNLGF